MLSHSMTIQCPDNRWEAFLQLKQLQDESGTGYFLRQLREAAYCFATKQKADSFRLHVRLPVYQQHFLSGQEQVPKIVTKIIRVAGLGLVLVGMVTEIKALHYQVFPAGGGFAQGAQDFQDAAVFAQDAVKVQYHALAGVGFFPAVVQHSPALVGAVLFIAASKEGLAANLAGSRERFHIGP